MKTAFLKLGSLAALSVTALALVGDSTECPDGEAVAGFHGTFTTDCTGVGAATGLVWLANQEGKKTDADYTAFETALHNGGLRGASAVFEERQNGVCRSQVVTITLLDDQGQSRSCGSFNLDASGVQTLTCATAAQASDASADSSDASAEALAPSCTLTFVALQ